MSKLDFKKSTEKKALVCEVIDKIFRHSMLFVVLIASQLLLLIGLIGLIAIPADFYQLGLIGISMIKPFIILNLVLLPIVIKIVFLNCSERKLSRTLHVAFEYILVLIS